LCGAGADKVTIEGKISIAGGNHAHIEGFHITGSDYTGIYVDHYARATILRNIIDYHDYDGIYVYNLGEAEISHNVIRYNDECGVRKGGEEAKITGIGNEIYDNGQNLCPSEHDFPSGFKE
jgi:parallel beta-helix repeat protein